MRDNSIIKIFFAVAILITTFSHAENQDISPMSISDPIEIVNGKPMNFTTDSNENWYEFTMGTNGNIALFGSDSSGSSIDHVYIYDENNNLLFDDCCFHSDSINLNAGKYRINVSDLSSGTLSVYSKNLTNPMDTNPILGSAANPYLSKNGEPIVFNTEIATNVYYFEMNASGNIILSGSDSSGSSIDYVYVYDENNNLIYNDCCFHSDSINLAKGSYYVMVSDLSRGTLSIYSNYLSNKASSCPEKGSAANPYLPKNGESIAFNTEVATNVYYFEMNASGNIILSGSDSSGSSIDYVYVYDENNNLIYDDCCFSSDSINLAKGSYYVMVSDLSKGTLSIYSNRLNANAQPPIDIYFIQGTTQCLNTEPIPSPGIWLFGCEGGRLKQGTNSCDYSATPVDPPGFTLPTCPDGKRLVQGTNECN